MARRLLGLVGFALIGAAPASDSQSLSRNPGQTVPQSGALSGAVAGQPLRVDRVPFNILADALLRRVSDRPFLACDSVLADVRPVSLRLESYQLNLANVGRVFGAYGYRLTDREGVLYVCDTSSRGPASGQTQAAAGPVYASGPMAVQTPAGGPMGRGDASGVRVGPPIGFGPDVPLGSPLTPSAPSAAAAGALVKVEQELGGYRPDFVSPAGLMSAAQPLFPELKFSVVQGEGQRPALFAVGDHEAVDRWREMMKYLDRSPDAVEVQAIVLEVTDGSRTGFGVSLVLDALKSGVGLNVGGALEGNRLTFHSGSFDGVLSAVAGSTNVRVVSSPRLRGRSGEKMRLQVGSDVPTLGAVVENPSGSTAQSIQYRSSGVIFEVTPSVLGKRIGLAVHQELSAFAETETGVRGSPTLSTRSLDTSLDLETGEWAVIGGLSSSQDQVARQSLFGLVPLGKQRSISKTELVLLVNVRRVVRQAEPQ